MVEKVRLKASKVLQTKIFNWTLLTCINVCTDLGHLGSLSRKSYGRNFMH